MKCMPGAAGIVAALVSMAAGHLLAQATSVPVDAGQAWSGEPSPLLWESTYTVTAPTVDGQIEALWQSARPLTVMVREALGGDHPKPVTLRALHTADTFYMVAEWADATRSDLRDPYVWNAATREYEHPTRPDDQFAIEFRMKGDFAVSMLTVMREYTTDVWHWKAGRGNPLGWVDDKYHVISQTPIPNAKKHDLHGGRAVYILRAQDAGQSAYVAKPRPTSYEGDTVDSFVQQEPTSSLADIRGRGLHDGQRWTLEIARKFDTGHPADDAILGPTRENPCAIAVLNDELYEEHSVSTVITLRFLGGPGDSTP